MTWERAQESTIEKLCKVNERAICCGEILIYGMLQSTSCTLGDWKFNVYDAMFWDARSANKSHTNFSLLKVQWGWVQLCGTYFILMYLGFQS